MSNWRPIDTAPKDEAVLVGSENGPVGEAYCYSEDGSWWWANTGPHDFDACKQVFPTHWQPLPRPPGDEND